MLPIIQGILIILLTKANCENEDAKSSLVFVFDTTGSMYDDLKQLREGAEMIMETALEGGNVIGDFVFVPFHDPTIGPATVTQDKAVFQNALEMVHVYGGGDCPEKSLGGIQLALDVSRAGARVYVFTDATAGDHRIVGKVLDSVQRKQSQVVFVLTGHCNDLDKPSFKVYQQIASASSGQVFNLNKTSVHRVLDFVKSSIRGRMVNLASSVNTAGSNFTQEVPVDSTLGEVTVSVSGARPQIAVQDPSGARVVPPRLITTLDLDEIMVVKVLQPEPGNWTITVGSDQEYSVKVSGLSNVTFNHGFSVEKPRGMAETSYRPLKGTYNHMMVSLTQKDLPMRIEFAEILSMDGSTLFELPLTEVDADDKVYLAEAFVPPEDDFFYVAINGKDEHNQPLRRIGTTAVQAKVPDVPYLTTSRKISAHAHSRVVLRCKVESLVPLTAMWTKGSHKLQSEISSLQTTSIEYVIEDITEGNTGTYKCFAKNVAGVSRSTIEVSIIVEPPQVTFEPANTTIEVGENATLTCTVFSEALLLDFQMVSNLTGVTSTKINVEPNMDGVYHFNKTIENASEADAGTYTCFAVNKGGTANQSATISILSEPTVQIIGPHSIAQRHNSVAQLYCQVDNCDVARWLHDGTAAETPVNGSGMVALEVNATEDGVWMCVGERGLMHASDTVEITVLTKPSVRIAGDQNITILNGTVLELVCEVTGQPRPRVIWHRETDEFLNHTLTNPRANTYVSKLALDSSTNDVDATYFCYGESSEGLSEDHVQVNVRRMMTIVEAPKDTSQELYTRVELTCLIDSFPAPYTSWRHNGTRLARDNMSNDNTTVVIEQLDFSHLGMYSCEADNGYEKVELNATLSVHGLERPSIVKEPTKIIVNKGDSTLLSCRIQAGNPTPSITWQHNTSNTIVELSNGTDLSFIATEQSPGLYTCVANNVVGQDSYDVELLVHHPPKLSSPANDSLAIEVGNAVSMHCEASGTPPPLTQWTKDGKPVLYSNNIHITEAGLTIDNVTEHNSGKYSCNASNSVGSVQKHFTLLVYEEPKITPNGNTDALEVLEGQLVEIPCEAKGAPKPVMMWEHNGVLINDDRKLVDDYGIRFAANLTDFGNYTCIAKNEHGNTAITYSVYVWVAPSIFPPLGISKDVVIGDDVNLQCDAVGFPIPTIQWAFKEEMLVKNTTNISFNEIGNLYITNATSKHEGIYVCLAKNLAGIANKFYKLNVIEPPKMLEDNYTGPYLATNLDSALTIACKASGKPYPYIVWSKDGVLLHKDSQYEVGKDGTLTIKAPTEDMTGTYTCTARNKHGAANKTAKVEVYSLPTREQSEESQSRETVVENEDAVVDCPIHASGNDTVKWYKDAELINTGRLTIAKVTRKNHGTYACIVSNAVGSAYSTVNVDVEWPPTFIDDEIENVIPNGEDQIHDTDEIDHNESNPEVFFSRLNKLVDNNNNNHQNPVNNTETGSSPNKYVRNIIDSEKIFGNINKANTHNEIVNYREDVTDSRNSVDVKDKNNYMKNIKIVEVVKGDDTYLDCQTDAKPMSKIKWLFNSKAILFADKYILKIVNVQHRHAGVYKCVASNTHGSVHRIFKLDVLVPPSISEFDVLEVSLMEGSDATLECNAKGLPEPSLRWTYNNTNWRLQNSTLTTSAITERAEGVFRCDAVNKAGASHIAYVVSVVSGARVEDVVAYKNGEGASVAKNLEVGLGTHIRVACKASGKPTPTVKWLRNGKLLGENPRGVHYADLVLEVDSSVAGGYTCVVANEGGMDERDVRIEVLEPPRIIRGRQTTIEVLSGQPYYLHCHAIGNPIPEVYWFRNGLPLKLFDGRMVMEQYGEVVAASSAGEDQAGEYTCVQRNRVGNDSITYLVNVLVPPPQPKDSVKSMKVRVNRPLTLTCPVEGSPAPSVMWIKHPYTEIEASSRVTLSGDSVNMSINSSLVSDSGNYSCIMANKAGASEVVFHVVVVKPASIAGNVPVEDHLVPLRRSIVLKCEADGHPMPTIRWLKDTQKLSESAWNVHPVLGNSLLALWGVTSRDAAQYICVVENEAGTAHRRYNLAVQVPGKWSEWGQWSLCNATCGVGQQRRARACHYVDEHNAVIDKTTKPDRIVVDESACKGPSMDRRNCQMPPCEAEAAGTWLAWSRWSACSATCGRGTQARARSCRGRCPGDNVQIRKCIDLPKCGSYEDTSGNDVYSKEDSKENYIPEAVFEKQPELVNTLYSPDVGESYPNRDGSASALLHVVNVTQNLDGSDVGACAPGFRPAGSECEDIDECALENNHCHSTQACENVPGGYRCRCQPGFESLAAGQRCMDINECSLDTSGCEFACVNTAGGYACACPKHMRLHRDRHHCYTVSSSRSYENLENSEYLSTSVEHPARYKHIRNV